MASNIIMSGNDEEYLLPVVQLVRDLGVSFPSTVTSSEQAKKVVAEARGVLFVMQRAFRRLTPTTFLPAYCALVRPLIEFSS